ncbi:MAG: TerC family protein, partial [Alphaproteobacteria bacterium]
TRIALLTVIAWVIGLAAPLFAFAGRELSVRDLVLLSGGLFLLVKATREIHGEVEGRHENLPQSRTASLALVVAQIMVLDVVFSLDSVITAVGLSDHLPVMIAAITAAILVMLWAAEPTTRFIKAHPTTKMLALSFLLLIGVALIADGLHFHIPRGYLYFAIAFSMLVEGLNQLAARHRRRKQPER